MIPSQYPNPRIITTYRIFTRRPAQIRPDTDRKPGADRQEWGIPGAIPSVQNDVRLSVGCHCWLVQQCFSFRTELLSLAIRALNPFVYSSFPRKRESSLVVKGLDPFVYPSFPRTRESSLTLIPRLCLGMHTGRLSLPKLGPTSRHDVYVLRAKNLDRWDSRCSSHPTCSGKEREGFVGCGEQSEPHRSRWNKLEFFAGTPGVHSAWGQRAGTMCMCFEQKTSTDGIPTGHPILRARSQNHYRINRRLGDQNKPSEHSERRLEIIGVLCGGFRGAVSCRRKSPPDESERNSKNCY
jgi:hypothetical protein